MTAPGSSRGVAGTPSLYARTRAEWRKWLERHHGREKSVLLILYKKGSDTPSPTYEEAVEEALCFGWIDSKATKRDAQSRYQHFARRNPKSNWSRLNRERAARMVRDGKMTPAGLAMIKLAKKTGKWRALEGAQNAVIPKDLQELFDQNEKAFRFFQAFPPSSKRIILEWILQAKRAETRRKRLEETVALAAQNIRANHYRR